MADNVPQVLIIEDDPDTRANLRDLLELDGYRVQSAARFDEAMARPDWRQISAVILDRRLPDGVAEDWLPQLKQVAPHASIIIVTGHHDLHSAIACLRQGAEDYILKPLNPDALRASLARIAQHQQAKEALRLTEERLRVALKNAPIVVAHVDRDLRYTWAYSPRADFPADQLLGKRDDELLPPEDAALWVQFKDQVMRTGSGAQQELPARFDGREYVYDVTAEPLRDASGTVIGLTLAAMNITRRKRIERQLRQAQFELEQRVQERTAELAQANRELREEVAERRRAQKELELLKTLALNIAASKSLETAMSLTLEEICRATGWDYGEVWTPAPDGDDLLHMAAYHTGGSAFERFSDESRGMRLHKGKGLAGRVWGSRKAEWLGDLRSGDRFSRTEAAMRADLTAAVAVPVLSGETVVAVMAFLMKEHRAEDTRLVQLVTAAVAPLGPVIERKQAEDALARHRDQLEEMVTQRTAQLAATHEQLRQADRLASIGTLAAGLGHDMNNVLLPVRARLDALDATDLSPRVREHFAAVRKSVSYLQQLSDGLHLLALDPDDPDASSGSTTLREWWSQVGSLLLKAVSKRVALYSIFSDDLPDVAVAPHRLTQAVLNLVVNAGEAIRDEGEVRIWARCDADRRHVLLSVSDTGEGMTPEVRKHAFDPFFTTKKRGLGTGLGLSLVRGVAQSAGGSVEIQSELGKGTTVTLTLPVAGYDDAATSGGCENPSKTAVISIGDRRVATFIASFLHAAGFSVKYLDGDDCDPGPSRMWITEPGVLTRQDAKRYLRADRRRRIIMLGPATDEWTELGVAVIDDPTDFEAIRQIIADTLLASAGTPP